jgi:sortase A
MWSSHAPGSNSTRRQTGPAAAVLLRRCLWTIGCSALAYSAFTMLRAEYDQALGSRLLERLIHSHGGETTSSRGSAEGSLVGRVEIPRVGLSAIVFEGTTDGTLARGVGHYSGSAEPGRAGNLVLAGHRDTFFRKLRDIKDGDAVTVTTPDGTFHYVVETTEVVMPDATWVLAQGHDSTLTLITCYPFRYVGNAPQRFVVRARGARPELLPASF